MGPVSGLPGMARTPPPSDPSQSAVAPVAASEFVPGHRGGGRAGLSPASLRPSTIGSPAGNTPYEPPTRMAIGRQRERRQHAAADELDLLPEKCRANGELEPVTPVHALPVTAASTTASVATPRHSQRSDVRLAMATKVPPPRESVDNDVAASAAGAKKAPAT